MKGICEELCMMENIFVGGGDKSNKVIKIV